MAHIDLGLSDDAFGRLSPQQFAALIERWRYRERREDARAALIASTYANIWRDRDSRPEPFTIDEFSALLAVLPEKPDWSAPNKTGFDLTALIAMTTEAPKKAD